MTLFGSDVSHFDQPDTRLMFDQGIAFQTHKAGGDANDAELGPWWRLVRSYRPRVLLGAYWVLYPGSPANRADAFLARLDDQCPGWRDGPFILQVDCEKWNGDSSTVPSRIHIQAFCDRLASRAPGLRPIVYAPKWVYGSTLAGLGYPLWASAYVLGAGGFKSLYPGDDSAKWGAYSGQVPEILQYSSSAAIGGQTTCDANAYRGTLDELVALVAPGWKEEIVADLTAADKKFLTDLIGGVPRETWNYEGLNNAYSGKPLSPGTMLSWVPSRAPHEATWGKLDALTAALSQLAGKDMTNEAEIIAGVLAGLSPEAIAAAIPADIAQQVVDILTAPYRAQ